MNTPAPAEPGLLLRLTGPLQSWGEHSHFNDRETAGFPTRSGVIGLLAAALGRARGESIDDLATLHLTVRADRPGVLLRDLHTVGGGLPAKETVTTAAGKKRSADSSTLISHRTYLADAAFTIALTQSVNNDKEDTEGLLAQCARALRAPHWPPYLGRRACPPEGPLLLAESDDALHHLVRLPLAAARPDKEGVEFLSDRPLDRLPVPDSLITADTADAAHAASEVLDEPVSFHPKHRAHRARPLYRRRVHLPAEQYQGLGLGLDQLNALARYLERHLHRPEGNVT